MQLPFNLAIALLGIYPRETKTYIHKKTCIQLLKPESKFCVLCDSIYVTFWKRQNYRNRKQISGCQGLGLGEQKGIMGEFHGIDHY